MPLPQLSQLIVGGYSGAMGDGSGIVTLRVGPQDVSTLGTLEIDSPSYLIRHPDRPLLYAVSEGDASTVAALRLTDHGPELINQVANSGTGACHLCFSPDGRFVITANYGSSSVSCFGLAEDGSLTEQTDLWLATGSGPDASRQSEPHPHQVVVDGDLILVPDLGTDRVHRLGIDAAGKISPAGDPIILPPGSGPRHLVVVDDQLVVACELSAEVWWGSRLGNGGEQGQVVPASGSDVDSRIYPSAIVADAASIFVANRGSDTVAAFQLSDGLVRPGIEITCGGAWPRDLIVTASHLWVANQNDGTVVAIARDDLAAGRIDGTINTPSPSCLIALSERVTA
ncbi:lactonase family protein [Microlunatus speluncae]|uniref:lactonase family protein n=1 Tax=Microlunatus speluncae TaxID=2594267 RepID=UPI00137554DD|nr:beta-propeller fold lactonase family protein [Microlunatus speluncae]